MDLNCGQRKNKLSSKTTEAFTWDVRIAIQRAQIQVERKLCPLLELLGKGF